MKIKRYTFVENLVSIIIAGLLSELVLLAYLLNVVNGVKQTTPTIKPVYEKIIEYADDDPVIEKTPVDVIEESEEEIIEEVQMIILPELQLTETLGKVQGPQEIEKYYNLPMDKVVQIMRDKGYTEADYPYYIREDGIKMLGDFIIVAADLNKYPKGTVVQTSLGQGIVCDTYTASEDLFDIAVNW